MSMQELAAVQPQACPEEEPVGLSAFTMKQQGVGREDAEDNVEFDTTSFGTVLTAAENHEHAR